MSLFIYIIWIIALITPGPDVFLVLRQGLIHSRKHALTSSLGIVTGTSIWIILAIIGIKQLSDLYPSLLYIIQLIGGLFLIYLGWQSIILVNGNINYGLTNINKIHNKSLLNSFLMGFITNASNPKALIFFGSIFSQFGINKGPISTLFITFITMIIIATIWFFSLSIIVSTNKAMKIAVKHSKTINLISGIIFASLGIIMVGNLIVNIVKTISYHS